MSKIYQFSTIGALMSGYFSPDQDIYKVCSCSSIGLGCSENLNAEMTILNGTPYTATAEEALKTPEAPLEVPFYQVTSFDHFQEYHIGEASTKNLEQFVQAVIPLNNNFIALRIKATFHELTLRRPYASSETRSVQEVSDHQEVSTYKEIQGHLIGFWTPEMFGRISVPGFHFHFLSEDKSVSGHVLDYYFSSALLQCEEKNVIEITHPKTSAFKNLNIDIEGLDEVIRKVEQ
ncbi:acetolactate decarboxylase [Acinetobacter pollinis]|uniref:Alpha-acetolactate decarboxylase n=1 Tax=Acinetobacter pollinis TaxID=2605270 RepID=A0ABU6DTZ0_9GAMM|nr:acetolactate decarboxylase [Acinetobacter pollinis]MEB5477327.1 acetolactate decarboxylase [Acinetobacter pollinis]